jgi:hypothetical protein
MYFEDDTDAERWFLRRDVCYDHVKVRAVWMWYDQTAAGEPSKKDLIISRKEEIIQALPKEAKNIDTRSITTQPAASWRERVEKKGRGGGRLSQ